MTKRKPIELHEKLGRPPSYNPSRNNEVLELMSQGASMNEVACLLDVHRDTLYVWIEKYPDFNDTIARGKQLALVWWEREGRSSLRDKDFNDRLYNINMQNRFGWSLKKEVSGEVKNTVVVEKADVALERLSPEAIMAINDALSEED